MQAGRELADHLCVAPITHLDFPPRSPTAGMEICCGAAAAEALARVYGDLAQRVCNSRGAGATGEAAGHAGEQQGCGQARAMPECLLGLGLHWTQSQGP